MDLRNKSKTLKSKNPRKKQKRRQSSIKLHQRVGVTSNVLIIVFHTKHVVISFRSTLHAAEADSRVEDQAVCTLSSGLVVGPLLFLYTGSETVVTLMWMVSVFTVM